MHTLQEVKMMNEFASNADDFWVCDENDEQLKGLYRHGSEGDNLVEFKACTFH